MSKHKRIVIKVGTKVITSKDRTLDEARIKDLAEQISVLQDRGINVILVTSGAKFALYLAFQAILQDGDQVMLLDPAWVSFAVSAARALGRDTAPRSSAAASRP